MKLSEIPFNDIYIGMLVQSISTGTFGFIDYVVPYEQVSDDPDISILSKDNVVCVSWDNNNFSELWHFWCDKILIAEMINNT